MSKKKRGYVRQLKRELANLKEDNNILRDILDKRVGYLEKCNIDLVSIRRRIHVLQSQRIISLDEMKAVEQFIPIEEEIKKEMIKEMLHSNDFLDMIKVEHDKNFNGIGSRLNLSIEVLSPITEKNKCNYE